MTGQIKKSMLKMIPEKFFRSNDNLAVERNAERRVPHVGVGICQPAVRVRQAAQRSRRIRKTSIIPNPTIALSQIIQCVN